MAATEQKEKLKVSIASLGNRFQLGTMPSTISLSVWSNLNLL